VYTIKLTIRKTSGCENFDVVVLTVTPSLNVDLGPDQVICQTSGQQIVLRTGFTTLPHQWSIDGVQVQNYTEDTILVTGQGIYSVIVNPGDPCTGADFVTITFVPNTIVELVGGNDTVTYCLSDPVQPLDAGPFANGVYSWTFMAPGSSTPVFLASTQTVTPTQTGTYMVTAISAGCGAGSDTVFVEFIPVLDITLPASVAICPGIGTALLEIDFVPGAAYTWRQDGVVRASGVGLSSLVINEPGLWRVDVLTPGGCSDQAQTTVSEQPAPVANFVPDPTNTIVLPTTQPVINLTDGSFPVGGIATWRWSVINYDEDGVADTIEVGNNSTLEYVFPAAIDSYLVVLEVTNAPFGCYDISEPLLVIIGTPQEDDLPIPTAFAPGSGGPNSVYVFNPVGFRNVQFRVYDRWGRLVFEAPTPVGPNGIEWDGEDDRLGDPIPEGVYVYSFEGEPIDKPGTVVTQQGTITVVR
jgi:hypothetical protein